MASTFSFGFSGDDIDIDDIDTTEDEHVHGNLDAEKKQDSSDEKSFPAERHLLSDWITSLPSQISYNILKLHLVSEENDDNATRTTSTQEQGQKAIYLGRRELFDVRTQLMAEEDDDVDVDVNNDTTTTNNTTVGHAELISSLEQGDLQPNFYEGGFKTWECALDLADVLLSSLSPSYGDESRLNFFFNNNNNNNNNSFSLNDDKAFHVIEMGCGTAVPSLTLFAQLLLSSSAPLSTTPSIREPRFRFRFTLADYNSTVLRMVTLSNFLLTWWLNSSASPRLREKEDSSGQIVAESETETIEEGELDVDATLLENFQSDLLNHGIVLDFISGGWSPEFVRFVLNPDDHDWTSSSSPAAIPTLILASETIYSPSSLGVFSETLLELLRNSAPHEQQQGKGSSNSTALIAAKKVYFGVGGGIDDFLHVLYQQPLRDMESIQVRERKEITAGGVKRAVLEIGIEKAI